VIGALVKTVIDWFGPVYAGALGYALIAGVIFLDRGAFTGVVIPGDLFLALGGIFAARGDLSLPLVILVGLFAGVMGETLSYWLGRKWGVSIIRHLPLANRFEKHLDSAKDYFDRHGGKTVFIGRYVSVAGTFMPFAAGMSEMAFPKFLLFDAIAIAMWAVAVTLLGYFLNSQIELADRIISDFGWVLLILVVLIFGGRFVWKRRSKIADWFKSLFGSKRRSSARSRS
jgi:membrane protein DedA with SNARE-associated domain